MRNLSTGKNSAFRTLRSSGKKGAPASALPEARLAETLCTARSANRSPMEQTVRELL